MAMVICASVAIAAVAVGGGWMGSHQHLGFTLVSRRYSSYNRSSLARMLSYIQLMGYARRVLAGT